MRQLLVIFSIIAMTFTAGGAVAAPKERTREISGSGVMVTRNIEIPAFTSVSAYRGLKVALVDKHAGPAKIEADDNLIDLLDVRVENGELIADFNRDLGDISIRRCNVTVTVPLAGPLTKLAAQSAAKIVCREVVVGTSVRVYASSAARIEAPIHATSCAIDASSAADVRVAVTCTNCEIDASSAAEVEANLKCSDCDVASSSAAEITLVGSSESLSARVSSAAELDAADLKTVYCEVEASSGADAEVYCSGELDAEASSGGSIVYGGDCTWKLDKSSGGSVRRRN